MIAVFVNLRTSWRLYMFDVLLTTEIDMLV